MNLKKEFDIFYYNIKKKISKFKNNEINTKIYTLMSVDVSNYTNKIFNLSKEELNEFHENFDNLATKIIKKCKGKILKKVGDCYMNTFKDANKAFECAIELQKTFQEFNNNVEDLNKKIKIKIGIHTGEVILRNKDIYGNTINIVARIERIAKPYHIVFTESTYSMIDKEMFEIILIGPKKLKGIQFPITLYRIKTKYD